jgi:hypothetical protein
MQTSGKPSVTQSGRLLPRSAMLRPINPSEPETPSIPVPKAPGPPIAQSVDVYPEIYPDVQPLPVEPEPRIEPPQEPISAADFTPSSADLDWLNAPTQGASGEDFGQDLQFTNTEFTSTDASFDEPEAQSADVPDWLRTPPSLTPQEVSMSDPVNASSDDDFSALFDQPGDLFGGTEPSPATSPEPHEELSLDWLDRLPEPPAAPAAPTATNTEGDLPDWMRDVPALPTLPGNTSEDVISAITGDMPDWMRDAAPAPTGSSDPTDLSGLDFLDDAPAIQAEEGDIPDWLAAAKDSFTPEQTGQGTAFPATGIEPGKFQPRKPGKRDSSEISFDINAILNLPLTSGEGETAAPVAPKSQDITPYEAAQLAASENMVSRALTDSLSDVSFEDTTIDEAMGPPSAGFKFDLGEMEAEAPAPPAEEMPSKPSLLNRSGANLRRLPTMDAPPPALTPAAEEPIPLPEPGLIEAEELPDFVEDMRPDGAPVELNISGVQVDMPESPVTTLSDPLRQLRERSRQFSKTKKSEEAATEGVLAEIAGVLTPASVPVSDSAVPAKITPGTVVISDLDQRRIRTLQALLEVEDEAEKAVEKARRRSRSLRLDRMFIAVLLFALISVPFFTDVANIMIPPNTAAPTNEQKSVYAAMDGLSAGQPVLMAFEYGPSGAGELDDLARVLLRDIFKKGAKPIIVSTNAAGALHAESLLAVFGTNDMELAALNRTGKPLVARQDYIVLRYLPAGAPGVRALLTSIYPNNNPYNSVSDPVQVKFDQTTQFGTDIEGKPSGFNDPAAIAALQRAPVIILAETPDEVRTWAEQYRRPGVQQILFAASAAADATARSYSASQPTGYIGPLVGLRDATIYRLVRQPNVGSPAEVKLLDQRWQSTGLGALSAGIFILFGAFFAMTGAIRQRRKPKGETNR